MFQCAIIAWTQAAVLHDHLWQLSREGTFDKADADGIFSRALRELEVPFLRRRCGRVDRVPPAARPAPRSDETRERPEG